MSSVNKNLRICQKGHRYYKSTDCPTCPICEQERAPKEGFLSTLAAPARRALESAGVKTVHQLSSLSASEVLSLHGMGPGSMKKLAEALHAKGLSFRKK
ncbi:RNA polymerase alpha subunit C-terminal domain-containing protein [Chryseolinea lacunae]|uniref:RNA polymerase alpha subunit C-terminal domain-containing protein n=1 Tax=Chryseolinea lacunae TaxID=2801331 RepID=A0ABS1KRN1_9BACT|nr:RNA polymerase alpha subunit C-terminal domain-containing protein [Chryseolinea lacunae]MBL0741968.1 RNA polymerase alpha subunit C-terminal domain-containing protein [Chryseolinea lacunae]